MMMTHSFTLLCLPVTQEQWINKNFLQLNQDKTVMVIGTQAKTAKLNVKL